MLFFDVFELVTILQVTFVMLALFVTWGKLNSATRTNYFSKEISWNCVTPNKMFLVAELASELEKVLVLDVSDVVLLRAEK